MNKTIAIVGVLGLFILGILIGALGMYLFYAQRFPSPPDHFVGQGMRGRFFMETLERQLDLSEEQKEQVARILKDSREAGQTLHDEMLPRVQELMASTSESILEILTPEQRQKFEQLMSRHRRDAERYFLGRGRAGERGQRFKGRRRP